MLHLASSLSVCLTRDELTAGSTKPSRLFAVQLLPPAGADVNVANDRKWTPLHQAAYGNDPEMVLRFLDAGASTNRAAHGLGSPPLAVAAFWGRREAVDVLIHVGIVPTNPRIAASVGRSDIVAACFDANGEPTSAAKAVRALLEYGADLSIKDALYNGTPRSWREHDGASELLPLRENHP